VAAGGSSSGSRNSFSGPPSVVQQWSSVLSLVIRYSCRLESASNARPADVTPEAPTVLSVRTTGARTVVRSLARDEKRLLLRPSGLCERPRVVSVSEWPPVREGGYRHVVRENIVDDPARGRGCLTQSVLSVAEDGADRPLVAAVVRA
jgi:hypothetical protein